MQRQIILDTETTGLSPRQGHRLIEIGCLEMIDRRLTGKRFHHYINPQREIDQGAIAVHGITNDLLVGKPLFSELAADLIQFIDGAELIIHNAPFDVGFLDHELQLLQAQYSKIADYCQVTDTLLLARQKHPGQANNLDALCRRYRVDNTDRELHGALIDAKLLALVYLAMTGGQTQLFADPATTTNTTNQAPPIRRLAAQRAPLPVVEPTAAELAAHQAMLALFNADVK